MEPITRKEKYLSAIAEGTGQTPAPITREEMFLAYLGGQAVTPPSPVTREEVFLSRISPGGTAYPNAEEGKF